METSSPHELDSWRSASPPSSPRPDAAWRRRALRWIGGGVLAGIIIGLGVAVAIVPSVNATRTAARAERVQRYAEAIDRIERLIDHEMRDKGLPAVSIALVDDQDIVWAKGYGFADPEHKTPATADTVYRVGSVSKLFTDIAVMQLVERGQVDLDKPVTTYLPDFQPHNPFGTPITLRQLMSHRAGLPREPPVGHYFDATAPSLARTVASLNDATVVYAPGTHTKYSNAGIAVVGRVLEAVTGQPFAQVLQARVIAPLGLQHSAFAPTSGVSSALAKAFMWTYFGRQFDVPTFQLGMAPAGGMYATVTDLGRFMSALFRRGQGLNGPILQPQTLESMWVPQVASTAEGAAAAAASAQGFGLGFNVSRFQGRRLVGHDGAIYGFATELEALPDAKIGVAVATTLDGTNAVMAHIAREAIALLLAAHDGAALPEVRLPSAVAPETAKALAGTFADNRADRRIVLENRNGKLIATMASFQAELKATTAAENELTADGRVAYGLSILRRNADTISTNGVTYRRVADTGIPPPPPDDLVGLIGEYGWDHNVLYVLERDGALYALIEWFFLYPLERVGPDRFAFPKSGLYDGEAIRFTRNARGQATDAIVGGVRFPRRPVGLREETFRITPLEPVAKLRKVAAASQPPAEAGKRAADLVELKSLDPTIKYDIRYATTNNFMSAAFYQQPRALLQRPAAEAVVRAHRALKAMGYGLLIHDAYRPWAVTKMFWDATPPAQRIFVADPSQGSRHNRGCAVDLTLYELATGRPVRTVGGYDEFSDRSFPDYVGGTSRQRWYRALLRRVMEAEGFTVYDAEWWHFDFNAWREYPILNIPFERLPAGKKAAE